MNLTERINLANFRKHMRKGEWHISYYDATHFPLSSDKEQITLSVELGKIKFDSIDQEISPEDIIPFKFGLVSREALEKNFKECWSNQENFNENQIRGYSLRVQQEIGDVLIRSKMIRPEIDKEDWETLANERNLILITDTNIIRRGIISSLTDIFERKPIWIIVPVITMLEIQEVSGRVRWSSNLEAKANNFKNFLSSRPMSTSSTRELLQLKGRVPVEFLEVPPELLRYYGGREHGEHKTPNILQDRLILEGVKRIVKEKSTTEDIFLLSGDMDLVKFARLENINAIYVGKKQLRSEEELYSARYDYYKKGFIASSADELLWELAHVFGLINAYNPDTKTTITINYYFSGKNVRDWEKDTLEVKKSENE
jgi:hypothetical protein